jgi:hypothetical protein
LFTLNPGLQGLLEWVARLLYCLEIIAQLATVLEVEPAELLRISSRPNTWRFMAAGSAHTLKASLAAQVFAMGGD